MYEVKRPAGRSGASRTGLRRRLSVLLGAGVLLSTVAVVLTAGPAQAVNNGVKIANWGTNKCLTIPGGSTASFTAVIQWPCLELPGQHWIFLGSPGGIRQVYNLDTGLCMQIMSFQNFGAVDQAGCGSGNAGLFWAITDLGGVPVGQRKIILKSYTTNFCLDLENGDPSDGVPMQVWQCNSRTNNQIWHVF